MKGRYQVIIVGGGPVGVALAVDLGLRGISVGLIERHLEPQRIPKGQNLTQRTMEHFYFWGLADQLRAARVMPRGYPTAGLTAYRSLAGDYWYSWVYREAVRSFYAQDNERLPQYRMEEVLRAKIRELPQVESRFGWTAESITQDAHGVCVTVAERNGPGREVLEGHFVIGCDGARSTVREQVGIERGGADYDQMMLLAVFRSRALHKALERFPERATYRVMTPELKGYWQFFGRIDVGEGWFFHAPVPASAAAAPDFDCKQVIWEAAGFEFPIEFDHVGFWDLRVAVADTYQVGRVFIAGDAAHSHPPYGGFGLNSGLEDVANLGWKLAASLDGWGGAGLLASYSEERRPIFKETGEDFIAARIDADREFLDRYSPERNRAEFEQVWNAQAGDMGAMARDYEPNYEGSSVIAGPSGGVCSAHGVHLIKARPGHHLTPLPLSAGGDTFTALGAGFTLLAFDAEERAIEAFVAAARALEVPLKVVRDSYDDGREDGGSRLILVRPDQYVVWTGDRMPPNATALMGKVVGHVADARSQTRGPSEHATAGGRRDMGPVGAS